MSFIRVNETKLNFASRIPEQSDLWLVLERLETAQSNGTDQISHSLHMISQLLHGRLTNASGQILRFKWSGLCGTGSEL